MKQNACKDILSKVKPTRCEFVKQANWPTDFSELVSIYANLGYGL